MLEKMAKRLREIFNVGGGFHSANGGETAVSSPIVVTLTSGATAYSNVKLFNANKNANLPNYGLPSDGASKVTVQSGSGVDYGQILQMLQSGSYKIKKITVTSSTPTLLRSPLKVNRYDALGDDSGTTMHVIKNTFQVATDQIDITVDMTLDRATEVQIGYLPKNSSVEYRFYPAQSFDNNIIGDYGKEYSIPQDGEKIITNRVANKVEHNIKNIL